MSEFQFYFGLDLGQVSDFSAAVVAEKQDKAPGVYYLRSAHRFDLRTPYTTIVEQVAHALGQPPLTGKTALLVDATGVGKAVVDLFKAVQLPAPLYEVTITAGEHVSREKDAFHVPKRDLAAAVQVAFEQELIKIAWGLTFGEILKQELKNFRVKINVKTSHDSYEAWREGEHDDLVLATALALWGGGQRLKRRKVFEGETPVPLAEPRSRKERKPIYEDIEIVHGGVDFDRRVQEGWSFDDIRYGRRRW